MLVFVAAAVVVVVVVDGAQGEVLVSLRNVVVVVVLTHADGFSIASDGSP